MLQFFLCFAFHVGVVDEVTWTITHEYVCVSMEFLVSSRGAGHAISMKTFKDLTLVEGAALTDAFVMEMQIIEENSFCWSFCCDIGNIFWIQLR